MTGPIEIPSGKDAAYENFPVGSLLLPAHLRPHIAAFYAFARAADDIADSPDLAPEEKVARLDAFEDAVLGRSAGDAAPAKARRMRDSLIAADVAPDHCVDLLAAFKQDAVKTRYRDWDDLMAYCMLSAAPVGRFLLDLHGGSRAGYAASDALCAALQVINHLQDCQADYRALDRVYIPETWLAEAESAIVDLDRDSCTPGLRAVLDRMLDATEDLLRTARALPRGLVSRRLAMESGAILAIAERLVGLLRRRDPLGPRRVVLSKPGYVWCCARGALAAL